jgi:hypothetical protein
MSFPPDENNPYLCNILFCTVRLALLFLIRWGMCGLLYFTSGAQQRLFLNTHEDGVVL